jgi:hypothetical protein
MDSQAIGISVMSSIFITICVYCYCSRRSEQRKQIEQMEQVEIIENEWN